MFTEKKHKYSLTGVTVFIAGLHCIPDRDGGFWTAGVETCHGGLQQVQVRLMRTWLLLSHIVTKKDPCWPFWNYLNECVKSSTTCSNRFIYTCFFIYFYMQTYLVFYTVIWKSFQCERLSCVGMTAHDSWNINSINTILTSVCFKDPDHNASQILTLSMCVGNYLSSSDLYEHRLINVSFQDHLWETG